MTRTSRNLSRSPHASCDQPNTLSLASDGEIITCGNQTVLPSGYAGHRARTKPSTVRYRALYLLATTQYRAVPGDTERYRVLILCMVPSAVERCPVVPSSSTERYRVPVLSSTEQYRLRVLSSTNFRLPFLIQREVAFPRLIDVIGVFSQTKGKEETLEHQDVPVDTAAVKVFNPHHVRESSVWGLQVYLSERGAVISPQAGTYEYPFLVVGAAPIFHPTALEKSAYRRFAGPSRTPKKRLLDHPFRHKHRDALPPTTLIKTCIGGRFVALQASKMGTRSFRGS
ncbi:hypothetical protein M5K25_025351 [Dendrobium thyrsiflorum]|uniref:Uncharacterized protein n=1 Tax=Dendrobium thyrsiflorum TaxID=117978 RepID=A0ABD0U423_DENTH